MKFDAKTTREIVQAKLLSSIFAHSLRNELVLKGGMAMRATRGSMRYTKDIDLAGSPDVSVNRIAGRINAAISALRRDGMIEDFTVSMPKQTETTQRWKIGGRIGGVAINLTVEVSRRDRIPEEHVDHVVWSPPREYGLSPILIDAFDASLLAASKTACLMDISREAARDFFDLWILVKANVEPPISLIRRFGREALERSIANIEAKLEKMDFGMVKDELLPFLPDYFARRMDEALWDDIRLTASLAAGEWIKHALDADRSSGGDREPKGGPRP